MTVDDGAESVAEIIETGLPRRIPQLSVDAHLWLLDAIGVVVHLRQRASLRTRVPLRQRMFAIAPHPGHDWSPSTSTRMPQTEVQIRQKLRTVCILG